MDAIAGDTPPGPPPGGGGGIDPNDPTPNWARPTHRHAAAPILHHHHRHVPGRPTENVPVPVNPYAQRPDEGTAAFINRIRGLPSVLPQDPAPPVKQEPPLVVTANDTGTIVAEGDGTAHVVMPYVFNPQIEGTFKHTDPNDPYFSAEEMSKRGPERHLPGYNFLGPGTEFSARMLGTDFYEMAMRRAGREPVGTRPYNQPKNKFDLCALEHDRVFAKEGTTKPEARAADKAFIQCIKDNHGMVGPMIDKVYGQVAQMAIRFKLNLMDATGQDDPFLQTSPDIAIQALNGTIAENATRGKEKEDEEAWWRWTLYKFFRLTVEAGASVSMQVIVRRFKREQLVKRIPANAKALIDKIAAKLKDHVSANSIISMLFGVGDVVTTTGLEELFHASPLIPQKMGETYARSKISDAMLTLFDRYFSWLGESWMSDSWRATEMVSEERLQALEGERNPDQLNRFRTNLGNERDMTDLYGKSLNNASVQKIRELLERPGENIAQSIAQALGIMNRLKISNSKTVFGTLQTIYRSTIKPNLQGPVTITRWRGIFDKRITSTDIQLIIKSQMKEQADRATINSQSPGGTRIALIQFFENMTYLQLFSYYEPFARLHDLLN